MQKYNNRNEVPDKYKCNLTDYFKDENEFNEKLEIAIKEVEKLKEFVGCTKDAKKLYSFLEYEMKTLSQCEDLYVYAYLINDLELGKKENIERKNKTEQLYTDFETNTSFFAPELLKLNKDEYNDLFKKEEKLKTYKADLDKIYREKEHILNENEEIIISTLTNAMNSYEDISSNLLNSEHSYGTVTLEDGTTQEIASNNYRKLLRNKDRKFREDVYNKFNKVITQYSGTNAGLLNSYVNMNDKLAKIRHFNNSWDKKLFHYNLSNKVYENLINSTEKNLDLFQKYFKIRKKVLKLEKLYPYDLSVELTSSDKKYTIEEAQEMILEAIKPLGNEYCQKFKKIFDENYIDYCQYKGKCSGAYSISTLNQNSRILMSFNETLDSVSTIAHEGGHNVHHQYLKENNLLQYRSAGSIIAEVASLTNECLLSSYLAENGKDDLEKLSGLVNIIEVINSNLYEAVREGTIEQRMYEHINNNGIITKEFMDELTINSLKKYYGDTVELHDEYSKNGWVRRSHYYMNFYLFSYAICISIASTIALKILDGDKEMLNNYIEFLKTGDDTWPKDTFKILGVDLEDEKVYENAFKYFSNLLDKFEEIYNNLEVR